MKKRPLALFLLAVLVISTGLFQIFTGEVSYFEGQGVELQSYNTSSYDSSWASPRSKVFSKYQKSSVTVDPDGSIKYGFFGNVERGKVTALKIDLSQPIPVNYQNNKYKTISQADWRPSESWKTTFSGKEHQVDVFRSIFGVTVTTTPSSSEKKRALVEVSPIQNFDLMIKVRLPQWKGAPDAELGIGAVMIPRDAEVEGTALSPPVYAEILGQRKRSPLDQIFTLGLTIDDLPTMSPLTAGTYYYGQRLSTGSSPTGAPDEVSIKLNWKSIKAGIEVINPFTTGRLEVTETVRLAILFFASRPLMSPSGVGGQDPATIPEEEVSCGFFESEVRDSNNRVSYCQKNSLLQGLALIVVAIVVIAVIVILLKIGLGGFL